MLFNIAIWFLQKWLKDRNIGEDAVFIISARSYSFDDYKKYEHLV